MADWGALAAVVLPAFATLFVAIDPIGLVPIFLALTPEMDAHQRRSLAWRAVATATILLLLFAFFGKAVLGFLGISLPAFQIAGGLLLFLLAVEMLFEKRSERRAQSASEAGDDPASTNDIAVFPLGVPLICGPGAIASIILLMSRAQGDYAAQGAVVAVLLAVLLLTGAFFFAADKLGRLTGPTFTKALTRVLGMILAALAVQFVLTGLSKTVLIAGS